MENNQLPVPKSRTQQVRRSLRLGVFDGAAFSAMLGLSQDYIVPFALALKATTTHIGLMTSIPSLTMALSQMMAPRLTDRAGTRKRLILPVVIVHALMWLPILLVPYLFQDQRIWWLIGFLTMSAVFGSLGNPAWGSLMADLVPEGMRGKYFGSRGRICGLVALVFSFIGAGVLQYYKGNVFLGFSIIFGGAMLFRIVSWYFLSRMYEPPLVRLDGERHGMLQIMRNMGSSNMGRFIIYVSLMNLVTNLAGPFFAVYMLRDLGFNYVTYIGVIATGTLANIVFLTYWGRRSDKAGNIKVLKVTSVLVPVVPLLWLASHQVFYLIPVQIVSGFAWAGFTLASANFLYDASSRENRTQYFSIFNAMTGGAICIGALLGGFLAPHLPRLLGNNLLTLFLISGVLRAIVAATLLRSISEVRRLPKTSTGELLFGRPGLGQTVARRMSQPFLRLVPYFRVERPAPVSSTALAGRERPVATRSPPE